MMGLCRGLAHQAIVDTTRGKEREKWLGWWSNMETFGLIPTRCQVASCVIHPESAFPVSFRYFDLLDACSLRMPSSPETQSG